MRSSIQAQAKLNLKAVYLSLGLAVKTVTCKNA